MKFFLFEKESGEEEREKRKKKKLKKRPKTFLKKKLKGCVLLVTFGNHGSDLLSAKQLMRAYANPAYITYLVLAVVGEFYGGVKKAFLEAARAASKASLSCASSLASSSSWNSTRSQNRSQQEKSCFHTGEGL